MIRFAPCVLPPELEALRSEVRAFIADEVEGLAPELRAQSWSAHDPAFSRKLGRRGWIGMTWPKRYGGAEMSPLARYVVMEELLAAGAPVGAHWIADRQSGPLLLRYGSEAQRKRYLPAIARGEMFFCIGMSEPDSGSDLASVRSRAERIPAGWRLSGRKLWTSGAHIAGAMIGLFRTDPAAKHGGLSQFLIDLPQPGVTIRPIRDLSGAAHFNEVTFDDVELPGEALIGAEGGGWAQVTAELAFERSGPERYLSTFRLFAELARRLGPHPEPAAQATLGRLLAHVVTLRRLSLALAGQLARGEDPALEAALVKDLGAVFEQEIPELAQRLIEARPALDAPGAYERVLAELVMIAPSFSLRGGTREILRGIIARGLGLR